MTSETETLLGGSGRAGYSLRGQVHDWRDQTGRFLVSKYGHYAVLSLVSLDVSCIFADFILSLYICEHTCKDGGHVSKALPDIQHALGIISFVISALFMVELCASLWSFNGLLQYFRSWFRCFDATVIIASFVIDVCLKGILEEAGSVVVILRLFRVIKIVDEFKVEAEEQVGDLKETIERLEKENRQLTAANGVLRMRQSGGDVTSPQSPQRSRGEENQH